MIDVPSAAKANVEQRLRSECGQVVSGLSRHVGGTQNRLVRLDTLDGAALLANFYPQDRLNRLHRAQLARAT